MKTRTAGRRGSAELAHESYEDTLSCPEVKTRTAGRRGSAELAHMIFMKGHYHIQKRRHEQAGCRRGSTKQAHESDEGILSSCFLIAQRPSNMQSVSQRWMS